MLVADIVALRAKINTAGGNHITDLRCVIIDNATALFTEAHDFIWDDANSILIVKYKTPVSHSGRRTTLTDPQKHEVDFISYDAIQHITYHVVEPVFTSVA